MSTTYFLTDEELLKLCATKEKMPPKRIKDIRKIFGLTQVKFSELIGVNYDTLRSWEGGYRFPSSPGYALLLIAERSPEAFLKSRDRVSLCYRHFYDLRYVLVTPNYAANACHRPDDLLASRRCFSDSQTTACS